MPVLDWEKTITCPYNPSHQITVERIQFHLVKCRRNHAGSDLKVCPFNASHHVPAPEEEFHMKTCSDRKVVEMEKYSWSMQQPRQHGNLQMPVRAELPPSEEDWELEATVTRSYDPKAKAEKMKVLRKIEGATPSERKVFRAMERARLDLLEEGTKRKAPVGMSLSNNTSKESVASLAGDVSFQQRVERETGGALRRPTLTPATKSKGAEEMRVERESSGVLRRPTLTPASKGEDEPRVHVRESVLAAHLGRGRGHPASNQQLRRPGSFLQPPSLDTTGLDSTMDSTRNSVDPKNLSMDTLDVAINAVGRLTIGRGRQIS